MPFMALASRLGSEPNPDHYESIWIAERNSDDGPVTATGLVTMFVCMGILALPQFRLRAPAPQQSTFVSAGLIQFIAVRGGKHPPRTQGREWITNV